MVANGSEPVNPTTIRRFMTRFATYGFKPEAMVPAYGLAECAVGLAFPPLGRPPLIDSVERAALTERGRATRARSGDPTALEFVSCGRPFPDHEIRLIDETGREVGERCEGRLQFRGPSATTGYFRNPEKTHELFDGDWLDSGDRAYMAGGEVFITGRVKDIIIRAGHNIYPQALEEAVGEIEGVRKGCVAVFASADPRSGTERIVIMAETSETGSAKRDALIQTVSEAATDLLGMPPDDVVLAPPDSVPKTASGKLRRAAARARYESGSVDARPRALWLQIARLTLAGLGARTWRLARTTRARAYAGYWWAVLYLIGAVVWPLTLLMPSRAWRWGLVHAAARLGLRLMGIRLAVTGLENLPEGGVIVVANHASYFDAMVLAAALPEVPTFTAKAELAPQIIAGPFLRRIGTLFVERWTAERGVEQTREAAALAAEGACLMFFPEGTLSRHPGLGEFHLGAFVAAAEVGVPVVSIAIRGTRSILRGGQWFPRHGAVNLTISAPIRPEGRGFEVALKLREVARAEILAQCGEPDLAEQPAQPQPNHAEPPARMLG
jgi:1-acyl-sn-glycerol-3-phosphate acyltransferase